MTFNSGWGKKGLIDVYTDNTTICDQILEGRRKLPKFVFVSISRSDFFTQCTEVRFASFLSGGFTTMTVMNPPEKKLEKRTSVHCLEIII